MQISNRIEAFSVIGNNLESFVQNYPSENPSPAQVEFNETLKLAKAQNAWFDIPNQLFAIKSWAKALQKENLQAWSHSYDISSRQSKIIGIVAAGNIPMVGFHDILSVVMSGHQALVKLSSNDSVLIPYIVKFLTEIEPRFKNQIQFVEKLEGFDAVIATGSDNTARYFEAYFKNIPSLIRKNRTSVAVLNGNESDEELNGLAQDILQYYGMGCRNVTKVFIPKGYNLDKIFQPLYEWKEVINHHKYANNYDYHKAVYLMKGFDIIENGFLMMKEDNSLFSPIATLFYEFYEEKSQIDQIITEHQQKIQCMVGNGKNMIAFGKAQQPELWDYADNVDTMAWLQSV